MPLVDVIPLFRPFGLTFLLLRKCDARVARASERNPPGGDYAVEWFRPACFVPQRMLFPECSSGGVPVVAPTMLKRLRLFVHYLQSKREAWTCYTEQCTGRFFEGVVLARFGFCHGR